MSKTNEVIQYLKEAKSNFIVMQKDNTPVCWSLCQQLFPGQKGGPVVYGSREDCDCSPKDGEYIITEYDYIKSVLLTESPAKSK